MPNTRNSHEQVKTTTRINAPDFKTLHQAAQKNAKAKTHGSIQPWYYNDLVRRILARECHKIRMFASDLVDEGGVAYDPNRST